MLTQIIAQIALALFDWLDKRMARGAVGVDATADRDRMRRGGARIREWLRQQGGVHLRNLPDPNGAKGEGPRVDAGGPRMDVVTKRD